jgi:hypothetical protein
MFEPIAKKFGIEPDGCWWKGELYLYEYPNNHELNPNTVVDCTEDGVGINAYSLGDETWRQDKLELPLPDWVWNNSFEHILKTKLLFKGQSGMEATVELCKLLDDEGLLK